MANRNIFTTKMHHFLSLSKTNKPLTGFGIQKIQKFCSDEKMAEQRFFRFFDFIILKKCSLNYPAQLGLKRQENWTFSWIITWFGYSKVFRLKSGVPPQIFILLLFKYLGSKYFILRNFHKRVFPSLF